MGSIIGEILFTGLLLVTSCTDIGRFLKLLTIRRLIGVTKLSAIVIPAELASVDTGISGLCRTEIPPAGSPGLLYKTFLCKSKCKYFEREYKKNLRLVFQLTA